MRSANALRGIFTELHCLYAELLSTMHELAFDEDAKAYEQHPLTNAEIRHACSDLKVLGKGAIRSLLLRWC